MQINDTQTNDPFGKRHPAHATYLFALIGALKVAWRSENEGAAIIEVDGTDHWSLLDDDGMWEINRRDEHGRWVTVHRFTEVLDPAASAMLAHDAVHPPGARISSDRFLPVDGGMQLAVAA